MSAEEISFHAAPPRTVKVHARGEDFRFCAPGCKKAFERAPGAYLS